MPKPITKVCRKCGDPKLLSAFERAPRGIGGVRATCKECRNKKQNWPTVPPVPRFARALDAKRYLITSAQSETFVHSEFFETLKVAAKHLDAELVVIPFRYKNPTSRAEQDKQDESSWWDERLSPYLYNQRKKLCDNLVLAADVKISPTAGTPLSGLESLTGAASCIIGSPKMQFKSVPAPSSRFPKILSTTGACTGKNYSDTKAGKIGEFHHFLGALVVEVQGKKFHLRQVNADRVDGSFTDLDKHYTPGGVFAAPPALALVMGDTHVRVTDPAVDRATFGGTARSRRSARRVWDRIEKRLSMVDVLDPETLVFHDLIDGETTNPHEVGNPFLAEAKRVAKRQEVKAEIEQVVGFVNERATGRKAIIVDSNHHDFLTRWMVRTDWRQDLKNARFYLETAIAMMDSARMTERGAEHDEPFTYWLQKLGVDTNVRCLKSDESFKVAGIEMGMHGHQGPNGARGSLKNLARLGAKVISGHSHTPGIEEGHYQVGTSTPRRLGYTKGPGSWLNTHCVVYATGKRALLTVIDGAWRL